MTARYEIEERRPKVLAMVAEGCTNAAIAKRMGVTVPSIARDLRALMTAYGATDRASLVAQAFRAGDLT